MTSTSITKIGGVVIVTQVIPQNDAASIPLETAAMAPQAPPLGTQAPSPAIMTTPPVTKAPPTAPKTMDKMTATFLRGQPQGLGVVQIVIGVLCILFSLTATYHPILIVHAPFCLAVSFVTSGSLALSAVRWTSAGRIRTTLAFSVISVVIALVGVAYTCWLLAGQPPSERFCDAEIWGNIVPTYKEKMSCISKMYMLDVCVYGPLGLLLVLLVLQTCVAITVCVFSASAINCCDRHTLFMVHDVKTLLNETHDSDVGLLDSDEEATSRSPPNSP